jgi:glutamate carboxypeptidase
MGGRRQIQMACSVIVLLLTLVSRPTLGGVNTNVMKAVEACEPDARALLKQLVQIDSGTADAQGVNAVGAVLKTELERIGANVQSVPAAAPALGDNVVATFTGTGKGRILLIAHMDTVFRTARLLRGPTQL